MTPRDVRRGPARRAGTRRPRIRSVLGIPLPMMILALIIAALLGVSLGAGDSRGPLVAAIDDSACDGCGRCFKKCPFDAIVGAPRLLHGVIADACTGCGLCTNVCPHGGISLYPDLQFAAPLVKPQLGGSRHA